MTVCKIYYVATFGIPTADNIHTIRCTQSSLDIDIDADVDDLQKALVEAHAIDGVVEAKVYRPYRISMLSEDITRKAIKDSSLDVFAENLSNALLIREALHVPEDSDDVPRQSLVVCLRMRPILASPANEDSEIDDVGLVERDFKQFIKNILQGPTPSVAAKSTNYNSIQASDTPLLDGRFNVKAGGPTAALPIELFNPVFGSFATRARDPTLRVPDDVVRLTAKLLRSVSGIAVAEVPRDKQTRNILSQIMNLAFETVQNKDKTNVDYMSVHPTPLNVNAASTIVEIKSELGAGGSDPSVQVSFSYAKFYCHEMRAPIRDICCCPAFIVGLAGPWLVIMGAVMTSRVIVQRLSSFEWLGCSRVLEERQVLEAARHLYALSISTRELNDYFGQLTPPSVIPGHIHPRYCPSINCFIDEKTSHKVSFIYERPLERDPSSVAFLAIREDTREQVVVKFVRRYGKDAHNHMANIGLAPQLIHYSNLGDTHDRLSLVVMEYVIGKTLHDIFGNNDLPIDILDGVKLALGFLDQGGYVLGDLRRPNVMIAEGNGPIQKRMRFIDFDWAGKQGDDLRYPFHVANVIRKVSGAEEYDLITKEHQEAMFRNL
ncbi:hypothetical protein AN958_03574 [Leucoagaricus sp. SymC.cos]|nr:hypothetical protein AN958_03574 [Leucoagaricus sp. SymC.cos]